MANGSQGLQNTNLVVENDETKAIARAQLFNDAGHSLLGRLQLLAQHAARHIQHEQDVQSHSLVMGLSSHHLDRGHLSFRVQKMASSASAAS